MCVTTDLCKSIPGFSGLGGFVLILFALMTLGWVLDKTHIIVISVIPFGYLLIGIILLPLLIWLGYRKIVK